DVKYIGCRELEGSEVVTFPEQAGDAGQQGDDDKLQGGEGCGSATARGLADQHHVQRPEGRRGRNDEVAPRQGTEFAATEQPGAGEGQRYGQPEPGGRALAEQKPGEQRGDHHIESREESGVGDGGRDQARLLECGTAEEGET